MLHAGAPVLEASASGRGGVEAARPEEVGRSDGDDEGDDDGPACGPGTEGTGVPATGVPAPQAATVQHTPTSAANLRRRPTTLTRLAKNQAPLSVSVDGSGDSRAVGQEVSDDVPSPALHTGRRPAPPTGHHAGMALPTPTLHTARLRLRPFTDEDADSLYALHSNAHVLRYWDSPPWTDRARAHRFIAACRRLADDGTGARLAMDRASDGVFVGWCGLTRWNPDHRSAALGYCLIEEAWGQGFATEGAGALLTWAYETLDLNRVQAEADTRNLASARVLEKLGFALEGTLREDCVVNGDVSDSWVFGLVEREWRPPSSLPGRSPA
jgi:ribosomal-protein-alanine N-acetyltransferase